MDVTRSPVAFAGGFLAPPVAQYQWGSPGLRRDAVKPKRRTLWGAYASACLRHATTHHTLCSATAAPAQQLLPMGSLVFFGSLVSHLAFLCPALAAVLVCETAKQHVPLSKKAHML